MNEQFPITILWTMMFCRIPYIMHFLPEVFHSCGTFSGAFCWDGSLGCLRRFTSKLKVDWIPWCISHSYCTCGKFFRTCRAICRHVLLSHFRSLRCMCTEQFNSLLQWKIKFFKSNGRKMFSGVIKEDYPKHTGLLGWWKYLWGNLSSTFWEGKSYFS